MACFRVEPVDIVYPSGETKRYPDLAYRTETVEVDYLNRRIGIKIAADEAVSLLKKMGLQSEKADGGKTLKVQVPPNRSGIVP